MMHSAGADPIYEQIEQRLAQWAARQDDLRALLVIGSRARALRPADAWSDLDTIVFVDDPQVYMHTGDWSRSLEGALALPVWFAAFGLTLGDPEWEYVFQHGVKVDLVFTRNRAAQGRDASVAAMADASPYGFVFERGARVLVDKSPQPTSDMPQPAPAPAPLPDQAAFDNAISSCLLELVRAVKMALRGEHWRAARALNEDLQDQLLILLEWQARGEGRSEAGQWPYGRFLEQWASRRAVRALAGTHAQPTAESLAEAVLAGIELLDWLSPRAAGLLGLRDPLESRQPVLTWLREQAGALQTASISER